MKRVRLLLLASSLAAAALVAGTALAQSTAPPPTVTITQRLDAVLPQNLPFVDQQGRAVRLGDYLGDTRPVLLVLGYYRCPQLCGLLMHGVLEALQRSGLPRSAYRIVRVSIDPEDTPAIARDRRHVDLAYAASLEDGRTAGAPLDLQLLTGTPQATEALAQRVGFGFERSTGEDAAARFAHAAGFVVVTPQGRVSRYLMGVSFDPQSLRAAIDGAARGDIGSFTDRIALLCAHVDLRLGRHSEAVMIATRVLGCTLVAGLALWCWRRRRPAHGDEA
jgi:protein SCO1/2